MADAFDMFDCILAGQFIFMFAIIGFALYFSYYQRKGFENLLGQISSEIGLKYSGGGMFSNPKAEGVYRGRNVVIDSIARGAGKSRHIDTRIQAYHHGRISEDMRLEPEGFATWIEKKFGTPDAQVGNPDFDDKYLIGTHSQTDAMRILDPDMQHRLLELKIPLIIGKEIISFEVVGYLKSREYTEKVLNLLCDIAEKVERG